MLVAYEGDQPYIFISYSHRNSAYVHGIIESLQKAGYRVWFDGGIEAGSEWPQYIASHLERSNCVLTFMSNAFVDSDNCKRELHFAQDLKKPLLNIYIEEVSLPAGLRMQLGLCQAMYRENFRTEQEFRDSLCRARILDACRDRTAAPVVMAPPAVKTPEDAGEVNWTPDTLPADLDGEVDELLKAYEDELAAADDAIEDLLEEGEAEEDDDRPFVPTPRPVKIAGWITVLLELSYFLLWPKVLGLLTAGEIGAWMLILLSVIPHVAIAVIGKLLIETVGARYTEEYSSGFPVGLFFLAPVVSVIAAFTGISGVSYDLGGFVKFLISLGLNVIPGVIATFIYVMTDDNKGAE